jgi:Carboxypeptidase regulatory-like domain
MIDLPKGRVESRKPRVPAAGDGGASPVGPRPAHSLFACVVLAVATLVACSAPAQPAGTPSTSGTPQAGTQSTAGSSISPGALPPTPGSGPRTTGATGPGFAVDGTVVSSPGCPGPALAESPCPDRPVAGARVELTRGSTVMASTTTDAAGRFEMRVPAGTYQVTALNVGLRSRASQSISVTGPVNVRLVVDSGMR